MSKNNKHKKQIKKTNKKNKQKKGINRWIKALIITLTCLIVLCAIAVGGLYYYKIQQQKAQEQTTQFMSYLNESVTELSTADGIKYTLDEKYYDEQTAKTFICSCFLKENGVDEEKITKQQIKDSLDKLFYFIPTEQSVCYLVQKPQLTLIEECTDIAAMNYLDYKYIGISDEQLMQKSKGVFICQNDPEFMKKPYGSSNLFMSGCGPIALTMAINYVKGKDTVLLDDVAKWAIDNDMYVENEGTMWAFMNEYPEEFGIECEEVYAQSLEEFEQILSEGDAMVTSMSKGHFTNNGHFITITGVSDGKTSVLDSSSIYRSKKEWDSKTVFNESNKYFWVIRQHVQEDEDD